MRSSPFLVCGSCLLGVDNYNDGLNMLRVIVYREYIAKYSMMFS